MLMVQARLQDAMKRMGMASEPVADVPLLPGSW